MSRRVLVSTEYPRPMAAAGSWKVVVVFENQDTVQRYTVVHSRILFVVFVLCHKKQVCVCVCTWHMYDVHVCEEC